MPTDIRTNTSTDNKTEKSAALRCAVLFINRHATKFALFNYLLIICKVQAHKQQLAHRLNLNVNVQSTDPKYKKSRETEAKKNYFFPQKEPGSLLKISSQPNEHKNIQLSITESSKINS